MAGVRPRIVDEVRVNIATEAMVFSLPKAPAMQFLAQHHLDSAANDGFADLQTLVEKKEAANVANAAVTCRSGQRGHSESGTTKLDVEVFVAPTLHDIDCRLEFNCGGKKIATAFDLKNGKVRWIGSFDSARGKKDATYLVFVRVVAGWDQAISYGRQRTLPLHLRTAQRRGRRRVVRLDAPAAEKLLERRCPPPPEAISNELLQNAASANEQRL